MGGPMSRIKTKSGGVTFGSGGGGGGNQGLGAFLAMLAKQKGRSNIGEDIQAVKQEFGGNVPVGTKANIGDVSIPLNRELQDYELSALAADQQFTPLVEEIKGRVKSGVFEGASKDIPFLGNLERSSRQLGAQEGGNISAMLTSGDPELQKVRSNILSLRRYVFGEGGKQLTDTEKEVVLALSNPFGKTDEQIISDLDDAIGLVQKKANMVRGGINADRSPVPGMNQQLNQSNQTESLEDELRRMYAPSR